MSKSTKVSNPNAKGGSGFIWAVVAIIAIAAVVIGYIVMSGQGKKTEHLADRERVDVAFTSDFSDNAVTLKSDNVKADAPEVDLYEDFSCSYCGKLAENTDADMQAAIEAGDVVVNVRTLNFLDRGNIDGHSTRAAAAVLAVAEAGETDVYWNYRAVLMEEQEDIYNKWSNDDFANAAKHVGASDAVVDKIRSGENVDAANSLATANADKLNEETGSVSSPRVIRDGEDVVGEKGDINQWLKILLG
ncbi:thioredoxin domain-containing protein [Corynebacterium sp.]|uniref:DsbA family protein n=1 Tax=Corynebacterium sp. TaxID=1720 RepID=UPI0019949D8F|nr:thioredoxin domain-containing protein [Corynebacterium sp.]HHU67869.1 thioredoxin domain-containing protein [Corynebacterium sp.]